MKNRFLGLALLTALLGCNEPTSTDNTTPSPTYQDVINAESWSGVITVTIVGNESNTATDGSATWEHQIEYVSSFDGTFQTYPDTAYTAAARYWKMYTGQVNARINNETFDVGGGTRTRFTVIGSEVVSIPVMLQSIQNPNSIMFDLSSSSGFRLQIPEVRITATHTAYEANDPGTIFDQGTNTFTIPGFDLTGLPYPSTGDTLSGTKTVDKLVFGATGDAVIVEAVIDWEITPEIRLAPLTP